jgi:RND family efflux transporter MFP subunit
MKKTILFSLAAIIIMAIGISLFYRGGTGISVKVLGVEKGEITSTLSATGKVISKEEAGISVPVPALVKEVSVEEGERVEAGAVLALLDDRESREKEKGAAESVREANENARQMNRDYEALVIVYSAGGVSRQSVEDAKSRLEMARAAAKRALAELNGIRVTLDKLKVVAPFAGIITRRSINSGEWAAPGGVIFSLAKEGRREIEIMVDESDGGLVKADQDVELTSDAFPGYIWVEKVQEVAPAVRKEGAANSIKVRVSCGMKAPGLKLGQQVDAKIRTAYRADTVKLPFDALISTGGKTFVAMVKSGVIHFIPVVPGIEDAASVEIVSGVSTGEEVILPEGKPCKEGERVKTVIRVPARP